MNVEFGTDGARGPYSSSSIAEAGFITPEVGFRIGAATVEALGVSRFVMVQDTRDFNEELARAIKEGVSSRGGLVVDLGILPTPAAAYLAGNLTRNSESGPYAAFSVSASHNPATDAGIKVFGAGGRKLDDVDTAKLQMAANNLVISRNALDLRILDSSRHINPEGMRQFYIEMLLRTVDSELGRDFLLGENMVIDAANGAAHWSAPEVFKRLGANVIAIHDDPTAEINKDCGATYTDSMIEAVRRHKASYGMALDGDADRLMSYARSNRGERALDGDNAIAIEVEYLHSRGLFGNNPRVVVTDYSSVGFERLMGTEGVETVFVENGDRYVSKELQGRGGLLGGERSGHVLFPLVTNSHRMVMSGDGTLTALRQLQAQALLGTSLDRIADYPTLGYARADVGLEPGADAKRIVASEHVARAIKAGEELVGLDGKVLVRGSGTEPVVRVLAKTAAEQALAEMIVNSIENALQEAA